MTTVFKIRDSTTWYLKKCGPPATEAVERLVEYSPEDDQFLVKRAGFASQENTSEPKDKLPAGKVAGWAYSQAKCPMGT